MARRGIVEGREARSSARRDVTCVTSRHAPNEAGLVYQANDDPFICYHVPSPTTNACGKRRGAKYSISRQDVCEANVKKPLQGRREGGREGAKYRRMSAAAERVARRAPRGKAGAPASCCMTARRSLKYSRLITWAYFEIPLSAGSSRGNLAFPAVSVSGGPAPPRYPPRYACPPRQLRHLPLQHHAPRHAIADA